MLTLFAIGVRCPLQALPLLVLQCFYKTLWLLAVAWPLRAAPWDADFTKAFKVFLAVVVVELLVIPWDYVFSTFIGSESSRRAGIHSREPTAI